MTKKKEFKKTNCTVVTGLLFRGASLPEEKVNIIS
jgi:hypothetical protein